MRCWPFSTGGCGHILATYWHAVALGQPSLGYDHTACVALASGVPARLADQAKVSMSVAGVSPASTGFVPQSVPCLTTCTICFPRWGARGSNPEPMG
jgi:hypothetical protein